MICLCHWWFSLAPFYWVSAPYDLYFWYVSWAFPSCGESPIYMHTHLSDYRHLHMSLFRDFEHHLQVSVGRSSPTLGWCLIRMFTTPCTYEMDRTSTHGKKPAALSVFSDELGWWDSQNSLWTAAIWAAQVTAFCFCVWRMSILAAVFFPHRSAYWSKATQATRSLWGLFRWVPEQFHRSTVGAALLGISKWQR